MIIPIAEHGDGHKIVVEREDFAGRYSYYFLAFNGSRSTRYRSLQAAQTDIKSVWGDLAGFKMLDISEDLLSPEHPSVIKDREKRLENKISWEEMRNQLKE